MAIRSRARCPSPARLSSDLTSPGDPCPTSVVGSQRLRAGPSRLLDLANEISGRPLPRPEQGVRELLCEPLDLRSQLAPADFGGHGVGGDSRPRSVILDATSCGIEPRRPALGVTA